MKRYHGGEWVKGGFYWSPSRWEAIAVPKGGGILPGAGEPGCFKLPVLLVLLLGPIMGALYVAFLPFIGFLLFFGFVGRKLLVRMSRTAAVLLRRPAKARADE